MGEKEKKKRVQRNELIFVQVAWLLISSPTLQAQNLINASMQPVTNSRVLLGIILSGLTMYH